MICVAAEDLTRLSMCLAIPCRSAFTIHFTATHTNAPLSLSQRQGRDHSTADFSDPRMRSFPHPISPRPPPLAPPASSSRPSASMLSRPFIRGVRCTSSSRSSRRASCSSRSVSAARISWSPGAPGVQFRVQRVGLWNWSCVNSQRVGLLQEI